MKLGILVFFLSGALNSMAAPVAVVNGVAIEEQEVRDALQGYSKAQIDLYLKDPAGKKEIVDQLIHQELMIQKAKQLKLQDLAEYRVVQRASERTLLTNYLIKKEILTKVTDAAT